MSVAVQGSVSGVRSVSLSWGGQRCVSRIGCCHTLSPQPLTVRGFTFLSAHPHLSILRNRQNHVNMTRNPRGTSQPTVNTRGRALPHAPPPPLPPVPRIGIVRETLESPAMRSNGAEQEPLRPGVTGAA